MDVKNESDTAHLLGSNIARRNKRGKRRNLEHVSNGQAMAVLSEPDTLPNDDEAQKVQLKRLKGLSGSVDDSLPSVRSRLAANNYAESRELNTRSTKETTPLLGQDDHVIVGEEKKGGSNDSSSDSLGLKGSYDSIATASPVAGKGERFKAAAKKW